MKNKYIIGVVGNPNCGKTTLFNALTGSKQQVGNWPGVTVERKVGHYRFEEIDFELVDLPGTYSLDISEDEVSIDEQIARDYVAGREADLIVNIVDASNLERNFYLTAQLLEMKVPMVVALNMVDVAKERGIEVNAAMLAQRLGCAVVEVIASSGQGSDQLKRAILEAAQAQQVPSAELDYAPAIEQAISSLQPRIEKYAQSSGVNSRWLALRLLEGDFFACRSVGEDVTDTLEALQQETEDALGDDIDISLADARYGFVGRVIAGAVKRKGEVARSVSDRIDRVVLNRMLGIPIFLFAMHMMFMFTINIGGAFIDAFDMVTAAVLVDGFSTLLASFGAPQWLIVLLANGIGGGIQVVASFIPIIASLFLFLSVLEDSGYMARAAFVMDRFLRSIGLPGKSFIPLIVGFGCTVPAVMATRTLEQKRDRFITVAMAPFMSCGARLPVYALFATVFFVSYGQNIVFLLYLIGIAMAVLTGLILKHTLLPGKVTPFVMELPPYHLPTLRGIGLRTWDRTKTFIVRAGRVIVPMVLVLNVLNSVGTDGSFGNEDSDKSMLSEVGRTITPLFTPFGISEDNWPASVGIFTGLLAKEAVVGTLDSLYTALGEEAQLRSQSSLLGENADMTEFAGQAEESFQLLSAVAEGFATIPGNLSAAFAGWLDPLGLDIGEIEDASAAAEEQGVATSTFSAMNERFDGAAGAFAYLLFVLLYMPCVAAIAAIWRETTARWTIFVTVWTIGMAYAVATLFYQAASFSAHPASSMAWIVGILATLVLVIVSMRIYGRYQARPVVIREPIGGTGAAPKA